MNINTKKRKRSLLGAFLSLLMILSGLFTPNFNAFVGATNDYIEFKSFYLDAEGYYRVRVEFLQDITLQ